MVGRGRGWYGVVRLGKARQSVAKFGLVGRGIVRYGMVGLVLAGKAILSSAGLGLVR